MADLPTRLDLFALGRDYVRTRAIKIDPKMVDVEGSDVNIVVGSTSVIAAHIIRQLAYAVANLLIDSAEEDNLDRLAYDRYGLTRKNAAAAVGTVRIFRTSASVGAGSVPIGTKLRTKTGVEYVTYTVANFGASDLTTTANVRAVQAGKATQVGANAIVLYSNPATLFDTSLQVNNDAATAGGEDIEQDDDFRNRIRDFWRTARRGILAAIEFGATSVPGIVSAQAVEALSTGGFPARIVTLYVADSSGVASNALATTVQTALNDYRAAGIQVIVQTSIPQIVSVALLLKFRAGVDTLAIASAVQAAIVEYINSLPVNGTLYISALYTVLQRFASDGLIINSGTIATPVGDLVPTPGLTLRTTLANVTWSPAPT